MMKRDFFLFFSFFCLLTALVFLYSALVLAILNLLLGIFPGWWQLIPLIFLCAVGGTGIVTITTASERWHTK